MFAILLSIGRIYTFHPNPQPPSHTKTVKIHQTITPLNYPSPIPHILVNSAQFPNMHTLNGLESAHKPDLRLLGLLAYPAFFQVLGVLTVLLAVLCLQGSLELLQFLLGLLFQVYAVWQDLHVLDAVVLLEYAPDSSALLPNFPRTHPPLLPQNSLR